MPLTIGRLLRKSSNPSDCLAVDMPGKQRRIPKISLFPPPTTELHPNQNSPVVKQGGKKGPWMRAAKESLRGRKLKACELFLNRDWSHMVINHWDIYSAIHKVIAYLSPAYLSL